MYALDIETGPYPQPPHTPGAFALEPYREDFYVRYISCIGDNGSKYFIDFRQADYAIQLNDLLNLLQNELVVCHNTIFDISCLLAYVQPERLRGIKWRDTMLLAKWANNSLVDENFSYSLKNCVAKWLPEFSEFLEMKDNVRHDDAYWEDRAVQDTKVTLELYKELIMRLPESQVKGYTIECGCLFPLAHGYMTGIEIDEERVLEAKFIYQSQANKILRDLNVTEATLRSPAKLGKLLFAEWGLTPADYTPSGSPSTSADSLKMVALQHDNEDLKKLLEAKQALTIVSKYVNGAEKAMKYLDKEKIHPIPKLFNSYTGRMTYNSKLMNKHQVGIAMHQLPRKAKIIKKCLKAPEGYKFFYVDFNAQELRVMAQFSGDKTMINAFNNHQDLHSIITERIYGTPYDTIVHGNAHNDPVIVDQRNCGKLTNLSSMYRIGANSLQKKFFTQYDKLITRQESQHYLNSYKKTYKGIPAYWDKIIDFGKRYGYVATFSDRRFRLKPKDWKSESSCINFPIQGSGTDLMELCLALVSRQFPDMIFQLAVHDSLTWLIPEEADPFEVRDFINNIDYTKYFDAHLAVTFPVDAAIGLNWGDLKPLED